MKINNIDLLNPDFTIECPNLSQSKEIYQIMRDNGITRSYGYGFYYYIRDTRLVLYPHFLKVGMSSPILGERRHQVGERIVRHAAWVPGWEEDPPKTSNGLDFWKNIQTDLIAKNKFPATFNKNNMYIAIWNVTKRMDSANILLEQENIATAWVEGELAHQHKTIYGELPPLNYADPSTTKAYLGPHISRTEFDALFDLQLT